MRDLLGVSIGMGTVHNVLQAATRQAGVISHSHDLSGIRVGIARQSLMSFVVGFCGGLGLYATPTVITNIFTATVPAMAVANAPVVDLMAAALAVR
jgi:hypothetical protein